MTSAPPDPEWPRLLSLSVHELRTPMTVVAGYLRMLLKDRAGPVTDQQRRLLEEAEKSCGRLASGSERPTPPGPCATSRERACWRAPCATRPTTSTGCSSSTGSGA